MKKSLFAIVTFALISLFLGLPLQAFADDRAALIEENEKLNRLEASSRIETSNGDIILLRSAAVSNCVTLPLPTTPGTPNYPLTAIRSNGERIDVTIWRVPCISDPSNSAVLMRILPSNIPFVCSGHFTVIQGGIQYDSFKLVTEEGGSSFCDDLFVNMTFILDQWSFDATFDVNKAFTLIHDWGPVMVDIPAYSGANPPPSGPEIVVSIEEPKSGSVVTGIGNFRGWAIAHKGIERLEYYIDGVLKADIPYGGRRGDIASAYPEYPNSRESGYGMTFSFGLLSPGQHTLSVRAFDNIGNYQEVTSAFETVGFHKPYFTDPAPVDFSSSTVNHDATGIKLDNVRVDGVLYDLRLEWRKTNQDFNIIKIQ